MNLGTIHMKTDGIILILLDHTRMRGPSVAHMPNFFGIVATILIG